MSMHPIRSPFRRNSKPASPESSSGFFEHYARGVSDFFRGGTRIRQFFFAFCSRKHGQPNARLVKTCYDMNLSPLIRIGKIMLACGVASALPLFGFGQTVFVTNGGQYAITAPIPGDQIHSHASINAQGGYLVWDDNSVDGSGQGISAVALDSNFSPVSPRFRVNQIRTGDQEFPQVALLKNGGAVFVWQSRPLTSPRHIFARFLSASNSWATGDILASSFTGNYQINPVVTTLPNGNVVVAYGSFNQVAPGSLQDVYMQIFSPNGQKIGSEILANSQYTDFNQRTPAITPLSDGRFVVAWVSEQKSHDNSVEIFARVFTSDGVAATDELPVSTTVTNVCANPSVAALANGGFVVSWGERDQFVRNNGWDIFARAFNSSGTALGGSSQAFLVNAYRFGDQVAPRVAALDGGAIVVWTSLAQDGSQEGVYGRFLDANGAISSDEFRVNTTTISKQIHPVVASDGGSRFLAAWSSFTGTGSGLDLFAQRYASSDFLAIQSTTNYAAPLIDPYPSDEGSIGGPTLPPAPGDSHATTFTNSLASVSGAYSGLFYDRTNGVTLGSAGYFAAAMTTRGTYSAKVSFGGKTYTISGGFNNAGHATAQISRGAAHPLTVQLQLADVAGGEQLRGTLSDGNWTADLLGNRSIFNKALNPAALAGTYVMRLPGDTQSATSPGGDSFGSVKVDASGNIVWSGSLSDGTKVTQKSAVSAQGTWPLYVSLYGGKGCVMGWLQFTNNGLNGSVVWLKSPGASKYYPAGFTNQLEASGIPYRASPVGARSLDLSSGAGSLILTGGGLSSAESTSLTLDSKNKVTDLSGHKLSLSLTPSSGLFHGSVLNPDTGKPITFQGALFPDWNVGLGYFLTPNQSGQVYLAPAQ